jgi:hypothetical protein
MKEIDLYDRDGVKLVTVYLTPTGKETPDLVHWQGRYFVRKEAGYVEVFAWPAFTREELEYGRLQGLIV